MPGHGFVIVRDPRGSLVHVRRRDGACVGCIEVGLYEIVRALVVEETRAADSEQGELLDSSVRRCDRADCPTDRSGRSSETEEAIAGGDRPKEEG